MHKNGLKILTFILVFLLVVLLAGCIDTPAEALDPTPEGFYANNVVTLVVPFGAGGGTDYAARLFASYWSNYVNGGLMVVKNMAGGGGTVGPNYVYNASPDGLIIGTHESGNLIGSEIFGLEAVEYDLIKFGYIGTLGISPTFMGVSAKAPFESIEELRAETGFTFGTSGLLSETAVASSLLVDILGMKDSRIVPGYDGTEEIGLALGRGEITGGLHSAASISGWIDKGFIKPRPLVVIDSKRSEWFPEVPAVVELAKLTQEQEEHLALAVSLQSCKPFYITPGVPVERLEFIREIFNQILADEGFLKQAKLRWSVWEVPINGADYTKIIQNMAAIPDEKMANILEAIQRMGSL